MESASHATFLVIAVTIFFFTAQGARRPVVAYTPSSAPTTALAAPPPTVVVEAAPPNVVVEAAPPPSGKHQDSSHCKSSNSARHAVVVQTIANTQGFVNSSISSLQAATFTITNGHGLLFQLGRVISARSAIKTYVEWQAPSNSTHEELSLLGDMAVAVQNAIQQSSSILSELNESMNSLNYAQTSAAAIMTEV